MGSGGRGRSWVRSVGGWAGPGWVVLAGGGWDWVRLGKADLGWVW